MGVVYFIQPINSDGPIKIGFTERLDKRLGAYYTHSPVLLHLVAAYKAERTLETALHRRFADYRLHGEWFEANPELLALIAGLRARIEDQANG